ncbi:MAG: FIST C-terminal domain-containing protein [Rhodospirillum sp.]|nr:FIST C-terminal domain-containing protein [Rhodospirillum sp.]MCF8488604.1 FIST C-terminal domain-containing protein [Rhodospirillum sp.]MCF8499692.1 FIST C-terminal domain-containing protein [Rhodospirillum sp.]
MSVLGGSKAKVLNRSLPWQPASARGLARVARTDGILSGVAKSFFQFEGKAASLVLAFVSPHLDFSEVCVCLRERAGDSVRIVAVSTAGELCSMGDEEDDGQPLYLETGNYWGTVVLQVFSSQLVKDARVYSVPLHNEDIRRGAPAMDRDERLRRIQASLSMVIPPFSIDHRDTLALTFVDGLSASENYLMEAIYQTGHFPCLFIGGSAGGTFDFQRTSLFDGAHVLEDHAVITLLKIAPGKRFGAFKSCNFRATEKSMVVLKADPDQRTVSSVIDPDTLEVQEVIPALARLLKCQEEDIESTFSKYTFGIKIDGELFIRSMAGIDRKRGFISFYCDINTGDQLYLAEKTDFSRQTQQDYTEFLCGKSSPIVGLLNDCILRRVHNSADLSGLDGMWTCPVAGFSTFGELFGFNVNQTVTGIFFFEAEKGDVHQDPFLDEFPIRYGRFMNYFTSCRLARLELINRLRSRTETNLNEHLADITDSSDKDVAAVALHARVERSLRKERSRLEAVMDSLFDGVLVVDGVGRVEKCNGAARRLLDVANPVGENLDSLLHWIVDREARSFHGAVIREVIQSGVAVANDDATFTLSDGRSMAVAFAVVSLGEDCEKGGAVISFRSIDALKRAQGEALQASRLASVGQLATGVAHEINTPVQYIGDNLRFLRESAADLSAALGEIAERASRGDVPRDVAADLRAIYEGHEVEYLVGEVPEAITQSLDGVDRVSHIVRSMKDFSHPGTTAPTSTDINAALESTLTVTRNEWKHIAEVETDFDPALPPILCFAADLNQVFLNLIINATHAIADAVEEGGVGRITLSTRTQGDWVEIRIADSGKGVPPDLRERIFDPFFTTKAVGKGTGQGLSISMDVIANKHGGTLILDPDATGGACFVIRLPVGGVGDGQ